MRTLEARVDRKGEIRRECRADVHGVGGVVSLGDGDVPLHDRYGHVPLVIVRLGVADPSSPAAEVGVDPVVDLVGSSDDQQTREGEGEGGVRAARDRAGLPRHHGAVAGADHRHVDGVACVRTLEARVDLECQLKGSCGSGDFVAAARPQRDEQAHTEVGDTRCTLHCSCPPV